MTSPEGNDQSTACKTSDFFSFPVETFQKTKLIYIFAITQQESAFQATNLVITPLPPVFFPNRGNDDNCRLRVKMAIRVIASEFAIAGQSQLWVKLAIHGVTHELEHTNMKACSWKWLLIRLKMISIADVDNRVSAIGVATEARFTCDCEEWTQPNTASHSIGARYAIEKFFNNPMSWCKCHLSRYWREMCDWKFFSQPWSPDLEVARTCCKCR